MMRFAGRMLPGNGAGPATGHTGVGLPSSARAPADVAPSATVRGFGRVCDVAAFVVADLAAPVFGFAAAGFGATLPVSCAPRFGALDKIKPPATSASMVRKEFLLDTNADWNRVGGSNLNLL